MSNKTVEETVFGSLERTCVHLSQPAGFIQTIAAPIEGVDIEDVDRVPVEVANEIGSGLFPILFIEYRVPFRGKVDAIDLPDHILGLKGAVEFDYWTMHLGPKSRDLLVPSIMEIWKGRKTVGRKDRADGRLDIYCDCYAGETLIKIIIGTQPLPGELRMA